MLACKFIEIPATQRAVQIGTTPAQASPWSLDINSSLQWKAGLPHTTSRGYGSVAGPALHQHQSNFVDSYAEVKPTPQEEKQPGPMPLGEEPSLGDSGSPWATEDRGSSGCRRRKEPSARESRRRKQRLVG